MKYQSLFYPICLLWYFITHANLPAIPTATGICEIEDFIEIKIEIGLGGDAEGVVIEERV
jgi:hypothetical protein